MQVFRRWTLGIALAIIGCFGSVFAIAEPLERAAHALRQTADSGYAAQAVKFDAELSQARAYADSGLTVRSDLIRESGGFRFAAIEGMSSETGGRTVEQTAKWLSGRAAS